MIEEQLSIHDKLFIIYNLTMKIEKERLSKSQFNDISVNDLHIIHIIYLYKNITISQIAKLMGVSKPSLTGNIDKLERLGYIKRVPNKNDRRIINIEFTPKGEKISCLHNKAHMKFINSLLHNCSDTEKCKLNKILDRLINQLNNEVEEN